MAVPASSPTRRHSIWEIVLLVTILLLATAFRFFKANEIPPGPSHDELRMMQLGELIVEGERPVHWTTSYSAEPLYMYLLALVMPVMGFTPFAARLVIRFAGLLLIPLVYVLARRLFERRVAVIASAVLSVTWWPVFFSRVALRGILLPLVFVPAIYLVWRGLHLDREGGARKEAGVNWIWLALGGGLIGLSWYTFTAARGLALLLPLLLLHQIDLWPISRRKMLRVALVILGMGLLVAGPFIYDVQVNPGAPEARLDQLGGVIGELRQGNLKPFIRQSAATVGMFLVTGDPNWRYNVSQRPAFGPILGLLAVTGLILCVVRWRRPSYFVALVWLILGLAPSMLTPEAPSFVRAIGALPPAVMLAGIGAVPVWDGVRRRFGRRGDQGVIVVLLLLLAGNGMGTYRDYSISWPKVDEVREIYQASLSEALQDLERAGLEGMIWVSEPFPDDRHLMLAERLEQVDVLKLRWFDAGRGLILPPAVGVRRYLIPDFAEPDQVLFQRWIADSPVVLEGDPIGESAEPVYRLYEVTGGSWVQQNLDAIVEEQGPRGYLEVDRSQGVPIPVRIGEDVSLLGYEVVHGRTAPGQRFSVILYWRPSGPVYEPLSSFVHLLDARGQVVGQYDGFDVPPWHWESGAVVAQGYSFFLNPDLPPGSYWLEVGLYNPQSMKRLPVYDAENLIGGDRLLLREFVVEGE